MSCVAQDRYVSSMKSKMPHFQTNISILNFPPQIKYKTLCGYDDNSRMLLYGLYVDKTELGRNNMSVQPLNLIVFTLGRDRVYTRASTTRIADLPIVDEKDLDYGAKSYKGQLSKYLFHAALLRVLEPLKMYSAMQASHLMWCRPRFV